MKTLHACFLWAAALAAALVINPRIFAQTNVEPPWNTDRDVVTIVAHDPEAAELPPWVDALNPAIFTVTRIGPTNFDLPVLYTVSGTASNGLDYERLTNMVIIPTGSAEATIVVRPIDDLLLEGTETVLITLEEPICIAIYPPPPGCYLVGMPGHAAARILDNDSAGHPPSVRLVAPADGTEAVEPADFMLIANAEDTDGYQTISTVEFFEGSRSLGITTNLPVMNPLGPFVLPWNKVAAGHYVLTAVATDAQGLKGTSAPVRVVVTSLSPPPFVRLNSPQDGAAFLAPADIALRAYAEGAGVGVSLKVDFFEGDHSLGSGVFVPTMCPSPYCPFYALVWSNAPPGHYVLTAVATDIHGAAATSAPVRITVTAAPLPVVTIVATDPDAREMPPLLPAFDQAVFTVSRTGPTNDSLLVAYVLGGTAQNAVDYRGLSGEVLIRAGARDARIEVLPLSDNLPENTETVILTLVHSTLSGYEVGQPAQATAFIRDTDVPPTNRPPTVRLTAPPDGAVFNAPATVPMEAVTVDPDGYASQVEFFANGQTIGKAAIDFFRAPDPGTPINFSFVWTNVVAGRYELTVRTVDDRGTPAVSPPVRIAVLATNAPPTNQLPTVTLMAADAFATEGVVGFSATSAWGSNVWGTATMMAGTNHLCITNTAAFRLWRTDGTNEDLTVFYQISGTASNGVDYEALPGWATIPAGKHSVAITVVPIDDNLAEKLETVVLALSLPPTASPLPPHYVIGYPRKAAAFILDNDRPRPPTLMLPDRLFQVTAPGTNGLCYRIDWSTNLADWTTICTNTVAKGALHFVDPDAETAPHRFYRIVPVDCPPEEE